MCGWGGCSADGGADAPPPAPPPRSAGCLATAGVLVAGLVAFKNGNSNLSQHLMRARVLAQGATVALMVAGGATVLGERQQ